MGIGKNSDKLAEDTNCGKQGRERADMKKKDLQSYNPENWKLVGFTLSFF